MKGSEVIPGEEDYSLYASLHHFIPHHLQILSKGITCNSCLLYETNEGRKKQEDKCVFVVNSKDEALLLLWYKQKRTDNRDIVFQYHFLLYSFHNKQQRIFISFCKKMSPQNKLFLFLSIASHSTSYLFSTFIFPSNHCFSEELLQNNFFSKDIQV